MKLFNSKKIHSSRQPSAVKRTIQEVGSDPYIDWIIILTLTSIISFGLIVAGVFTYLKVATRLAETSTPVSGDVVPVIDEKMLRHVLEQFSERATERELLLKGYKGPADPNI